MRFSQERVLYRRPRALSQQMQRELAIWPAAPEVWAEWGNLPDLPPVYPGPSPEVFWLGCAYGAKVMQERIQMMSDVVLTAYPEFLVPAEPGREPTRPRPTLAVDNTRAPADGEQE
jgi:hypothetical protein